MDALQSDSIKKQLLKELEKQNGIVTAACNNADISRSTFYEWLKIDEEFKAAVDEIQEVAIDYVESKLFQKIEGVTVRKDVDPKTGEDIVYDLPPSDTAIIFYLKTKAKKRGYIEKSEVGWTDKDGNDITPKIIFQPAPNCNDIQQEDIRTDRGGEANK